MKKRRELTDMNKDLTNKYNHIIQDKKSQIEQNAQRIEIRK